MCFVAVRMLWKYKVFNQLLVLLLCLVFLSGGGLAIFSGLDMASYHYLSDGKPAAVVHFRRESDGQFSAHVKDHMGHEYIQKLTGDYWQLDARVLRLNKHMFRDIEPMIRLEYFYALNVTSRKAASIERSAELLHTSSDLIDSWPFLKKIPWIDRFISLQVTSTMKKPVTDKTVYIVNLTNLGLVAEKSRVADNAP